MRNRKWEKGKVNQVLILERWMELQEKLIADLARIQSSDWRTGATIDEDEIAAILGRIGDKLDDSPTLYLCHHCQDTAFKTSTDADGVVWSTVCDECEAGNRLFEGRKVASIRQLAEAESKRKRQQARDSVWGTGNKELPV